MVSDTKSVGRKKERVRDPRTARLAKRINDAKKYRQKLRPLKTAEEREKKKREREFLQADLVDDDVVVV